jgi:hypothetical protein
MPVAQAAASHRSESAEFETLQRYASHADDTVVAEPEPLLPSPSELPPITGPQRYQMQFTTSEEHARLVDRAKLLLARERPRATLGELHLEAMKLLVASLEKRKFAVTDRPKKPAASRRRAAPPDLDEGAAVDSEKCAEHRPSHGGTSSVSEPGPAGMLAVDGMPEAKAPRRRGRYVPAAVRREVFARDQGRCTFANEHGERCRETRYLELHHLKAFAHGGENIASNLTLRCAAHNALAAEQDFGRQVVLQRRGMPRHESFAAQGRDRRDQES